MTVESSSKVIGDTTISERITLKDLASLHLSYRAPTLALKQRIHEDIGTNHGREGDLQPQYTHIDYQQFLIFLTLAHLIDAFPQILLVSLLTALIFCRHLDLFC